MAIIIEYRPLEIPTKEDSYFQLRTGLARAGIIIRKGKLLSRDGSSLFVNGALVAENYYRITSDVYASNDAEVNLTPAPITTYTLAKTMTFPSDFPTITVRTYFEIQSSAGGGCNGKIYKNNVAIGTERLKNGAGYQSFTEDFEVTADDLLQVFIKDVTEDHTPFVKNFRILGTVAFDKYTITAS